jgi:hypothetical protein
VCRRLNVTDNLYLPRLEKLSVKKLILIHHPRGEFVRFAPSWQWPKPVQKPRPKILVGGAAGPTLFAQIAEYADGWIPIGGAGLQRTLPELRRAWEARGRDPGALRVVPMGVLPDPAKLEFYASLGVTEVVLRLPSAPRDVVMPLLDEYARYVAS